MAVVRYAPLVDEAHGKLGNMILSRYKQTDKVYIHHRARNPRTPAQEAARAKFRRGQRLFKFLEQGNYPVDFFDEPSDVSLGLGLGWLSWRSAAANGVSQTPANQFMKAWMEAPWYVTGADTDWSPFWKTEPLGDLSWTVTVTGAAGQVTIAIPTPTPPAGRRLLGWVVCALDERWRKRDGDTSGLGVDSVTASAVKDAGTADILTGLSEGNYLVYVSAVTNLSPWPYDFGTLRWHPVKAARAEVT